MYEPSNTIKSWADSERPREKLMLRGRSALSHAELLAILLGSGTRRHTALDLAKEILDRSQNDLLELGRWELADFCKLKGVGEAKALTLMSALELGRRRASAGSRKKEVITHSADVYRMMKDKLMDLPHEEFWVVMMNRKNAVVKTRKISSGGVAGTVVDPKMVFKYSLQELASGIILVHNHPSGNLQPSEEDIRLTKTIQAGGDLLSIKILDHLIFTDEDYFSFVDKGIM